MSVEQAKRPKSNKFKVIPNLSLKGKDILTRLRNRSLTLGANGQYALDEKIDQVRRMSKIDIAREALSNQQRINNLTNKIQSKRNVTTK